MNVLQTLLIVREILEIFWKNVLIVYVDSYCPLKWQIFWLFDRNDHSHSLTFLFLPYYQVLIILMTTDSC